MKSKSGVCQTGALYLLVSANLSAAIINIGTGPDTSYVTLETPNLGIRQYAISYTYDPVNNPLGGTALLNLIEVNDPEITFVINDFGSPGQPNEFFSSLEFNGQTEINDFSPGGSAFSYWVAGGQAGAAGFGVPGPVPLPESVWTLGAGLSVNFRLIEPGSNEALVFAPTQLEPSVAPIPEPTSILLLFLGSSGLIHHRRRI